MPITLVVADDHPIVLQALLQLFSMESDIDVVADCKDGNEALRAVREYHPDVLVLDMSMPEKDGLAVLREMQAAGDTTSVALLTAALDDDEVLEAIQLGVRGVVLKEMAPKMLVQCVRKVHAGGEWLEKESVGRALQKLLRRQNAADEIGKKLTSREIELVKHIAAGLRNKQIADKLFLSEGTIKAHLHNIYKKLDLSGRVDLVRYAQESGLV